MPTAVGFMQRNREATMTSDLRGNGLILGGAGMTRNRSHSDEAGGELGLTD